MRRKAAGIALAIALLLTLGVHRSTPIASVEGPSPMDSWARRIARTPAKPQPEEPPEPTSDAPFVPTESIAVHLRPAGQGFLVFPRNARLDPVGFWPLPGEAPFPQGQTAEALQDLIAREREHASPEELAWLDLAWEEGLDPAQISVDDPWAAVLALEIARRHALSDLSLIHI